MADFDAIVVGSGCAGPIAALELARAGRSVLVIERGNTCGAKNVSGGRLYTHSLRRVLPDFAASAPLERRIVRERISLLAETSNTTIEFTDADMSLPDFESYSVLRARFDPWLAEQAEAAGAAYINGIAVESLVKEDGRVAGVRAGDEEITAEVVILADGLNSLLTGQAVGAPMPRLDQVAVGVKQVIALPPTVISDRALTGADEGMAWMFVGEPTHGRVGGGFVYTNRDTISIGVVATLSSLVDGPNPVYQMLEGFKEHPAVAPLIAGGEVVEHSGHLVAEGGYDALPPLVGDGVLLAGESAMMCINAGYSVRGMDLAIAAGMHAGQSAAAALAAGDTSAEGLASYRRELEESFVLKDMRTLRRFPQFMEKTPRLFGTYPTLASRVMRKLFLVDGSPVQPLMKGVTPILKQAGYLKLAGDVLRAVRAL